MTRATLREDIDGAVLDLLNMARGMTWNSISDNCKFILTEIKDSEESFHEQRRRNRRLNDKKSPMELVEVINLLDRIYDNLYDINLHIYRALEKATVIDIRYYPKSCMSEAIREKVLNNPPMLHCKVSIPFWIFDKSEKFDINWEHHAGRNRLRRWWMAVKWRVRRDYRAYSRKRPTKSISD